MSKSDWNATQFFSELVAKNKLANAEGFTFCKVSGLDGFEETLHTMQTYTAFFCVSDIADGYTELNNSPRTRRVKTVFIAMRHAIDDMDARNECMETMRELFRQLMSVLTLERVKLEQDCIYLDPRISFNEIDRYFFSGCACAYFQIAVDVYTDLRFSYDEWLGYEFDIWLMEVSKRTTCMNFLRDYLKCSLGEAVDYVNNAPCLIKESVLPPEKETFLASIKDADFATFKIVSHGEKP